MRAMQSSTASGSQDRSQQFAALRFVSRSLELGMDVGPETVRTPMGHGVRVSAGSGTEMETILLHVLKDAAEATPEGGRIVVSVYGAERKAGSVPEEPEVRRVVLTVFDEGDRMAEARGPRDDLGDVAGDWARDESVATGERMGRRTGDRAVDLASAMNADLAKEFECAEGTVRPIAHRALVGMQVIQQPVHGELIRPRKRFLIQGAAGWMAC